MTAIKAALLPTAVLILLFFVAKSQDDFDIDTIEGRDEVVTTKPPARGRASNFETNVRKYSPFKCIVCDDIKDKNCEPWDSTSYIKNCYEDPRINKSRSVGCRKMIQKVGDKTYVARHCTNIVDDNVQGCVDRVGTRRIKVTYCHCRGMETCNQGQLLTARQMLVFTAAVVLVAAVS